VRTREDEVYLVRIVNSSQDNGCFLRYVGGGWGPDYLPTDDIYEACQFSDGDVAMAAARAWSREPRRTKLVLVRVTTIVSIEEVR
jgi:hypothetical protein